MLGISSSDGFCSFLIFEENELVHVENYFLCAQIQGTPVTSEAYKEIMKYSLMVKTPECTFLFLILRLSQRCE